MASFIPDTDGALATWATNLGTLISSSPVSYGLTQAQADSYDEVRVEYLGLYQRAMDPATRTKPNLILKDEARKKLVTMSRSYAKLIEGTASVTDAQKAALGLNIRKKPTPIPPPSQRPSVDIVSVSGRTVTLHLHDSTSSKRRKPSGVAAAWIYSFVGAEYPTDPTTWQFQGVYTKTECKIDFPGSVPGGSQVWICAVWVNPKQEAGPISTPVTTNLQVGVMGAPAKLKMAA